MELGEEALLRGRMFKKVVERRCSGVCAKYGLKQLDAEVLFYMSNRNGSITSTEICRDLIANKGQVSQTMDALCRKGYILAAEDASDRRFIRFTLTGQSQEAVTELRTVRDRLRDDIFSSIPEAELAQFKATARKLFDRINAIMDAEL